MKTKLLILIIVAAAIGLFSYWYGQKKEAVISHKLPPQFKLGLVNECRKIPRFITQLNMQQPAIDSKQQSHAGGILIRDVATNRTWQHPSWQQSGYLAGFDRDKKGNLYVAPLPYVSLTDNPPQKQNQIYKIDANSAQMELFLKMPSGEIPDNKNPFGTMGLFYDCDTNSLYVSSLAGSKPRAEKGVIYQIDLASKKVVSQLAQTDAIGIGVFNTLKGKKLYFGSARSPHVYSVLLDENGHFIGKKHYEFSLSTIQGGDSTVVKKMIFSKQKGKFVMTLKETEFGFRLLAENNLNRKKYHFHYSLAADKWTFFALNRE